MITERLMVITECLDCNEHFPAKWEREDASELAKDHIAANPTHWVETRESRVWMQVKEEASS